MEWSKWTPVTSATGIYLSDVWGSGANDVWAVGAGGTILHWNGTEWSATTTGISNLLSSVGGSSANDVWAVGYGPSGGIILHLKK